MEQTIKDLVDRVYDEGLRGAVQDRSTILKLLEIDLSSPEAAYVSERAQEFARAVTGGHARIAGAIGVDLKSCQMNCRFCSFGEEWGLVEQESILTLDQVIVMAREYVENGVTMVTLRTTEFFDVRTICDWVAAIRREVPGTFEINLNVGELTPAAAYACYEAGASSAYHVLRMREGIDTPFDPEVRKRSIEVIAESPLKLNTCIEPVGPEHTAEEVADRMAFALSMHPASIGIMPRVPVPGTPLGELPMLPREALRLMVGVLRLAAGSNVKYVSMHPDDELGLEAGTNAFSVERGAVPRDTEYAEGEWRGLTARRAAGILAAAGFDTAIIGCDPRFRAGACWWRPGQPTLVDPCAFIDEDGTEYVLRDDARVRLKAD